VTDDRQTDRPHYGSNGTVSIGEIVCTRTITHKNENKAYMYRHKRYRINASLPVRPSFFNWTNCQHTKLSGEV